MLTPNVNRITCLSLNRNCHLIAGGSWCKIWLWQIKPNYCLTSLNGHSDWVVSIDISSDGSLLVSGSQDKTIQVWNLKNQRLLGIIKEHTDVVNSVLISPDQKVIISASADKTIKIYDLQTQKIKQTLKNHSQTVNCIAVSPDSKLLFSGSSDKTVKIWNIEQGKLLYEITDYQGEITAIKVQEINNKLILITGSSHGELKLWQINSKTFYNNNFLDLFNLFPKKPNIKLIQSVKKTSSLIRSIVYSRNKKEVVFSQSNGEVTYYTDPFNLKKEKKSQHGHINDLQFNFTEDCLISATDYGLGLNISSTSPTVYVPIIRELGITIINQDKKIDNHNDTIEVCKSTQLNVFATLINGETIRLDNNYLEWKTTVGNIDSYGVLTTNYTSKTVTISVKDKFGLIELSRCFRLRKSQPYLDVLTFSHFKESLEFNERFCFKVQGLDKSSQPFNDFSVNWIVSRGKIDNDGNFQADNTPEEVIIKAIATPHTNSNKVTLEKTIKIIKRMRVYKRKRPSNNVKLRQSFYSNTTNNPPTIVSPQSKLPPFTSTKEKETDERKRSSNKVKVRQPSYSNKPNNLPIQVSPQSKLPPFISTKEKETSTNFTESIVSISPVLSRLELCQTEVTLLLEQEYQFKVLGFDQFDKPINMSHVKWKSSYGGTINQSGVFRGYYRQRIVTVTVSVDGVSTTAKVTLLPVLRELLIKPQLMNLKPGESQQFTVYGLDQYGGSIEPNDIHWEATGGTISQSGLFTAHVCAKGNYEIVATALDTPLFSQEDRTLFTYIGVSTRLTSWFISYEKLIKNILFSQEFNQSEIEEDNDIIEETDILSLSGEMFDLAMQGFIHRQLRKQIARCLAQISSFSFKLAEAKVSASVKVNIVPVLRSIKIQPSYKEIKQGEKCQFRVYGLDQYNEPIEINEQIKWEASGGNCSQKGLLETQDIEGEIIVKAVVGKFKALAEVKVSIQSKLPTITSTKEKYFNYILPNNYQQQKDSRDWFLRSQLFYDGYSDNEGISYEEYLEYVDQRAFQRALIDRLF